MSNHLDILVSFLQVQLYFVLHSEQRVDRLAASLPWLKT